jgi:hypothetical protein
MGTVATEKAAYRAADVKNQRVRTVWLSSCYDELQRGPWAIRNGRQVTAQALDVPHTTLWLLHSSTSAVNANGTVMMFAWHCHDICMTRTTFIMMQAGNKLGLSCCRFPKMDQGRDTIESVTTACSGCVAHTALRLIHRRAGTRSCITSYGRSLGRNKLYYNAGCAHVYNHLKDRQFRQRDPSSTNHKEPCPSCDTFVSSDYAAAEVKRELRWCLRWWCKST